MHTTAADFFFPPSQWRTYGTASFDAILTYLHGGALNSRSRYQYIVQKDGLQQRLSDFLPCTAFSSHIGHAEAVRTHVRSAHTFMKPEHAFKRARGRVRRQVCRHACGERSVFLCGVRAVRLLLCRTSATLNMEDTLESLTNSLLYLYVACPDVTAAAIVVLMSEYTVCNISFATPFFFFFFWRQEQA